jgi:hypothetical protein
MVICHPASVAERGELRSFNFSHHHRKSIWITDCHISKHFPVYGNAGCLHASDETAIANTVDAGSSIDTNDPQTA